MLQPVLYAKLSKQGHAAQQAPCRHHTSISERVNTVLQTLNLSINDQGEVGGKAVGEALGVNTVCSVLVASSVLASLLHLR